MSNPFKRLLALLPNPPLLIGEVVSIENGVATVAVVGGGFLQARGATTVGARVFFRDGVIEGPAPDLPTEVIEV